MKLIHVYTYFTAEVVTTTDIVQLQVQSVKVFAHGVVPIRTWQRYKKLKVDHTQAVTVSVTETQYQAVQEALFQCDFTTV